MERPEPLADGPYNSSGNSFNPQVLLDALRHGYVSLREDISLLVFDEAHHAADKHPYNVVMREFHDHYSGSLNANNESINQSILGLKASPIF